MLLVWKVQALYSGVPQQDEETNLTFKHDEEPILVLAEKMSNLFMFKEEKVIANLLTDREDRGKPTCGI